MYYFIAFFEMFQGAEIFNQSMVHYAMILLQCVHLVCLHKHIWGVYTCFFLYELWGKIILVLVSIQSIICTEDLALQIYINIQMETIQLSSVLNYSLMNNGSVVSSEIFETKVTWKKSKGLNCLHGGLLQI
jgi:hypothetical protein